MVFFSGELLQVMLGINVVENDRCNQNKSDSSPESSDAIGNDVAIRSPKKKNIIRRIKQSRKRKCPGSTIFKFFKS